MIWKWVNCSMGKCTNVPINQFDNLKMNLFGYWLLATGYWLLATGYCSFSCLILVIERSRNHILGKCTNVPMC